MRRGLTASMLGGAALLLGLGGQQVSGELHTERGNGPTGLNELNFNIHRLVTDHAEGIITMHINGDTVETAGEFVMDCGERAVDVNHDGAPDLVTVGWYNDGLWLSQNPKKQGVQWEKHSMGLVCQRFRSFRPRQMRYPRRLGSECRIRTVFQAWYFTTWLPEQPRRMLCGCRNPAKQSCYFLFQGRAEGGNVTELLHAGM